MDKFRAMEVFAEVVRRGGFTAASETLSITPQMVGQHVRALEADIGAQLLYRTTRKVSVTEIGARWFEHCEAMLRQQSEAEALVHHVQADAAGLLCITAPTTFGTEIIAPTLPRFRGLHPRISIDLNLSNQRSDLVSDGFELAVRIGDLPDSELISRPLGRYRTILAAAPEYLERKGRPAQPTDLANHDCLSFGLRKGERQWELHKSAQTVAVMGQNWLRSDNGAALRNAALAGAGIVAQPELLLRRDLEAGRLVRVLPEHELPDRSVNLVFMQSKFMTPKLRSIIDFAAQHWKL